MLKHLLVINTQSFGDILLSTHIATLAQRFLPDTKVHFFVRPDLTLTTAETSYEAKMDMLKLIQMQNNISTAGWLFGDNVQPMVGEDIKAFSDYDVIVIQGWSSDLGIVKSQLKPFYDKFKIPSQNIDTETKFIVKDSLPKNKNLTIGLAGTKDFIRKWHNEEEYEKLNNYLVNHSKDFTLEFFGVDCSEESYSEQLKRLTKCHLLISPMGSLVHFAAGLGIDTISLTSVFPTQYDCPEFYHSGNHTSIKVEFPKRCAEFNCIKVKQYDNQQTWGNPATNFGFWPRVCPFTNNGMSCNYNITADNIIEKFEAWIQEK